MKNLYQFLPSPAPDYAGVSSLLFEMDILTVFLDPHGCNGQTLYYSEPRYQHFNYIPKSFSFSITEIDAIKGIDSLLIHKVKNTLNHISAKAIALVGCPVSSIIGTDFCALEKKLEKETGLPAFFVNTTGLDSYEAGQKKLLSQLISKFTNTNIISSVSSNDVHILGATPLDGWDHTAICEYTDLLMTSGANSVVCWGHGGDLDAVSSVYKARLLIAVSASGLHAARILSKQYGIPYIIGFPVGAKNSLIFSNVLKDFFLKGTIENHVLFEKYSSKTSGKTALIIADQINANAIRSCLINEFGFQGADVASIFSLDPYLCAKNDFHIHSEQFLAEYCVNHKSYDVIIGDPLYRAMLPANIPFISCPHPALSGMLYWKDSFSYFGEKGTLYFQNL